MATSHTKRGGDEAGAPDTGAGVGGGGSSAAERMECREIDSDETERVEDGVNDPTVLLDAVPFV